MLVKDCLLVPFGDPRSDGWQRYDCPECQRQTGYLPPLATPPKRTCAVPRVAGCGDHLHAFIQSMKMVPVAGCGCPEKIAMMNEWGPAGCREHRAEICDWLKSAYNTITWGEAIYAGRKLLGEEWFSIRDPFGSILSESIRRSALPGATDAGSAHPTNPQ